MSKLPFVSVIIPTFRCWSDTLKCVASLEKQSYPNNFFEIIVVNNDPNDPFPEALRKVICIDETKVGSYAARNYGIQVARGEILAFIDSDCIATTEWLAQAVQLITESNVDRIAGKIVLTFSQPNVSALEAYQKALSFNQKKMSAKGLSVTANMISKRKVFDTVGNFNDQLLSGGDWEWNRRATRAGFTIAYGEGVTIHHPARSSWGELLKKSLRVNSSIDMGKSLSRNILNIIIRLPKGLFPPIKRGVEILRNPELTRREKMMAWLVCYALKIFGHGVQILAGLRIIKPTRS
jgi:glycosyltransferase involved in cell wall biosynthesis